MTTRKQAWGGMKVVTVVPCFEEAGRLHLERFSELVGGPGRFLLFVNDGSRDQTGAMLDSFVSKNPRRVGVLHLARNQGKAEAVRVGLLHAIEQGADLVGYCDADLATPPQEMLRLYEVLAASRARFALASRVALLGCEIERTAGRHYLGRVFATAASMALGLRVYDTQCGAKAIRVDGLLRRALEEPFSTRWVFDVELMMRLLRGSDAGRYAASDFIEMPLHAWEEVKGSKLSAKAMLGAAADLGRLALRRRLEGRRRGHSEA